MDYLHRVIVAWCAARCGMKRIKPVISLPVASTGKPLAGTSTYLPCYRRSDTLAPATHICTVSHAYTSSAELIHTIVIKSSESISLCDAIWCFIPVAACCPVVRYHPVMPWTAWVTSEDDNGLHKFKWITNTCLIP